MPISWDRPVPTLLISFSSHSMIRLDGFCVLWSWESFQSNYNHLPGCGMLMVCKIINWCKNPAPLACSEGDQTLHTTKRQKLTHALHTPTSSPCSASPQTPQRPPHPAHVLSLAYLPHHPPQQHSRCPVGDLIQQTSPTPRRSLPPKARSSMSVLNPPNLHLALRLAFPHLTRHTDFFDPSLDGETNIVLSEETA